MARDDGSHCKDPLRKSIALYHSVGCEYLLPWGSLHSSRLFDAAALCLRWQSFGLPDFVLISRLWCTRILWSIIHVKSPKKIRRRSEITSRSIELRCSRREFLSRSKYCCPKSNIFSSALLGQKKRLAQKRMIRFFSALKRPRSGALR